MSNKKELILESGRVKSKTFALINVSQEGTNDIFAFKINQFLSSYKKPKKKFSINEIASLFSVILETHFMEYDAKEREKWRNEFGKVFLTKEDLKNENLEQAWYNKYHKNLEAEIMEWMMGDITLEEAVNWKKKGYSPSQAIKEKYHVGIKKAKA